MWCVWWDRSGIIHWEIMVNGFCYWWNDNGLWSKFLAFLTKFFAEWNMSDKFRTEIAKGSPTWTVTSIWPNLIAWRPPSKPNAHAKRTTSCSITTMPAPMSKAGSSNPLTTKGGTYSSIPPPTLPQEPLQTTTPTARSKIGKFYNDLDELVTDIKVWIASKDHHFFARGIDQLPHK